MTVITKSQGRMSYSEFAQLLNSHAIPATDITTDHVDRIVHIVSNTISQSTDANHWREVLFSDTSIHLIAGGKMNPTMTWICINREGEI